MRFRFVTKFGSEFWLDLYDDPIWYRIPYFDRGKSGAPLFGDSMDLPVKRDSSYQERIFRRTTLAYGLTIWREYWEQGRTEPKYAHNVKAYRNKYPPKALTRKDYP